MELEFAEGEPPCQVDGEELRGTRFSVEVCPAALRVVVAPGRRWAAREGWRPASALAAFVRPPSPS